MQTVALRSRRIEVADHFEGVELFFSRGWTDGLPVMPPTEERVDTMLQTLDRDPGEVVEHYPPRKRRPTSGSRRRSSPFPAMAISPETRT